MTPPSPKFEGNPEEEEDNKAEGKEDGEVAMLGAPANEAKPLHAPLQQVARLEELIILPTETQITSIVCMCMEERTGIHILRAVKIIKIGTWTTMDAEEKS